MDIWDTTGLDLGEFSGKERVVESFYAFEPWDVKEREQWLLDLAVEDGVDLRDPDFVRHVMTDPHPFQGGYFHSTAFFRVLFAGSRCGKSICAEQEVIMQLTGELPIAFRHENGEKTGVKRPITEDNILRWGRFDAKSGEFIDHNTAMLHKGSRREWDCGEIIGVGHYPEQKIGGPGSEAWIGTYRRACHERWWPVFTDKHKLVIPPHLIDKSKGVDGVEKVMNVIHLVNGAKITFITYEAGFERFEAHQVFSVILDEEPPDPAIVQTCMMRCKWMSLVETPYQGLTYTKDLFFPSKVTRDKQVFHATLFDCPYRTKAELKRMRQDMPIHERAARLWGVHALTQGTPYYETHTKKIMTWYQKYDIPHLKGRILPKELYGALTRAGSGGGLPCIMDVEFDLETLNKDNMVDTWRIYSKPEAGRAYLLTADPAVGAAKPEECRDKSAALVFRWPNYQAGDDRPRIVAAIQATQEVQFFAKTVAAALRYYNNATLAAEAMRCGSANAILCMTLADWPYWYYQMVVQDSTRKQRKVPGFDNNPATREAIFRLIGGWLAAYEEDQFPEIPDKELLRELAGCVLDKHGKVDHPYGGSLDLGVCFGIGLYVFESSPEQVRYNGPVIDEPKKKNVNFRMIEEDKGRLVPCGLAYLGYGA